MNALQYTTDADISRALLEHVVNPKGSRRQRLEIATLHGQFHMVEVHDPILARMEEGKLVFVSFDGTQPIGRAETFVWPAADVEEPIRGILALEVYGQ